MTEALQTRLPFVVFNGVLDVVQATTHNMSALALSTIGGHPLGTPSTTDLGAVPPTTPPDATDTAGAALATALDQRARDVLAARAGEPVTKGLEAPADIPAPNDPPRELGPEPFEP